MSVVAIEFGDSWLDATLRGIQHRSCRLLLHTAIITLVSLLHLLGDFCTPVHDIVSLCVPDSISVLHLSC